MAYYPPNPSESSDYRQIKAKVPHGGLKIRTRRGYRLPRGETDEPRFKLVKQINSQWIDIIRWTPELSIGYRTNR
jgi:hypothetical protein